MKNVLRQRFYPDSELVSLLAKTFGCVRVVTNDAVEKIHKAHEKKQKIPAYKTLSGELTKLKKRPDRIWLNEVYSVPLQQKLRHVSQGVKRWKEKQGGLPRFVSKDDNQSAAFTKAAFDFNPETRELRIAKYDQPLNIRWSKTLPKNVKITSLTITKDKAGRYHVSLVYEDDVARHQLPPQPEGKERWMGADIALSPEAFLVIAYSDGTRERITAPRPLLKYSERLAKLQQALAKKQKNSSRWLATKKKIAKLYAKMSDIRKDFLHKLSTRLIRENQAICLETLGIQDMMEVSKKGNPLERAQKRGRNRAWHDIGAHAFKEMVKYKAARTGRTFVPADRYFRSSHTCSLCHAETAKMPLNVRQWTCSGCGTTHDRDDNAADNLLPLAKAGLDFSRTFQGPRVPI